MGRKSNRRSARKGAAWDVLVKWVEPVSIEDVEGSKVLKSIASVLEKDKRYAFIFQGNKGELVKHTVNKVFPNANANNSKIDTHNVHDALAFVKIHYRNGTWEYGLKYWNVKAVVNPYRCRLLPIYLKDGFIDERTGEVVDSYNSTDSSTFVPYRILRKLPTYNERMRRNVNHKRKVGEDDDEYSADDELICDVIDSNYTYRGDVEYGMPPVRGLWTKPMAWAESYTFRVCRMFGEEPSDESIEEWECYDVSQWTPDGPIYRKLKSKPPKYFKYTYLKSCYEDVVDRKVVCELYPMSSLLVVKDDCIWDEEQSEVWNNMRATVSGNI